MNKTWKVAQREFAENVRTKSFWIGIGAFPVILFLVVFVPTWLRGRVDVRKYAVMDQSGWLLEEIDQRTRFPDLLQMYEDQQQGIEIPATVTQTQLWMELTKKSSDDERKKYVEGMQKLYGMSSRELEQGLAKAPSLLPAPLLALINENKELLRQLREEIPQIFAELEKMEDKERAGRWIGDSGFGRFERVEVAGGLDAMKDLLERRKLFAYFVIGPDPVEGNEGCRYSSDNFTDTSLRKWFEGHATSIVRSHRIAQLGIPEKRAKWLNEPLSFEAEDAEGREVGAGRTVRQWAPVGFVYALWISIFMIAQMLLTNTIEEKSNRIIEVLLSSVSPLQLMTGKILGIAMTGLTLIGSWVFFFVVGILVLPLIEPSISQTLVEYGLRSIASDPLYIGSFLVYFTLGYILFASLLVGIGSVCNTLKEAQNLMQPVIIVLMLPLLAMIPIASDPNGLLARVLSFIPPLTPFVMMNRVGGPPEIWEYIATTVLLLVTIVIVFRGAARIFRIGILMTGKRPNLKEIFRWMRAPIGATPRAKGAE